MSTALDGKVTLLLLPGFECPPNTVLELKKATYRLQQAPLVWYKRLLVYSKMLGFSISQSDPCLFWLVE
jgi:hypothetical protein